jgi:hypothetical protein
LPVAVERGNRLGDIRKNVSSVAIDRFYSESPLWPPDSFMRYRNEGMSEATSQSFFEQYSMANLLVIACDTADLAIRPVSDQIDVDQGPNQAAVPSSCDGMSASD